MSYQYILFDLDGTLTNPAEGIFKSINYALGKIGEPPISKEQLSVFIGPPLKEGYKQNLGFDDEKAAQAVAFYRERYRDIGLYENELLDGAGELLQRLYEKGKTIAMATSKPEDLAISLMEHFDLKKYFTFIGGAEWDTNGRNSKTDIIKYTLDNIGVTTESELKKAVIIGDRHHDIEGAINTGISSIGVMVGFGSREEFEKANHIAETLLDVENYI